MTCNLIRTLGGSFAAAVLISGTAFAQSAQDTAYSIGNNDALLIDGKTFDITHGRTRGDVSGLVRSLDARALGPGVVIFRSGDKLYIVDASLADVAAARQRSGMTSEVNQNELIHIAYETPKNPAHQEIYDLIKQRRVLETLKEVFSPLRLPVDLYIKTVGCDGVSNAWYERDKSVPTIKLCYEYLQEVWQNLPKETTPVGITPRDALIGQLFFAVTHEFGHAVYDIFKVPVFGRQEDAADQFAAYIMLQFGGDRAHHLIQGAAYSYRGFVKSYKDSKDSPQVTVPLKAFSSDHGSPEERFYNLVCMAYGYDPKEFADLVDKGYLPESRAKGCYFEYRDVAYAFHQVVSPHIDAAKARKVLDTRWFADADIKGPASR